ncbi:UNVERIFIED_CONTAM: thioredoxin, putative [Hammondia hammondi]|eukprot:XP_008881789.1 thioredoxin, putative [Hammondia hammondi]
MAPRTSLALLALSALVSTFSRLLPDSFPPSFFSLPLSGVSAAPREAGVVNVEDVSSSGAARSDKSTKSYSAQQRQQTRENQLKVLESGAMTLSGLETYKEFIASHPFVLVMYYAPWCYWSKATLPEFHAAAKILAHHEPPVILALVDSVEEEEIANHEDIREFPTLKFFIDGRPQAYEGRRHRTHLVHWVDTRLDRDKSLTSKQHLDEVMSNRDHGHLVIVGAFSESGYDAKAYVSVARRFGEDVFFGHVQDPTLVDHLREHIRRLLGGEKVAADMERRLASPPFIAVFSKHAHEPDVHLYTGNPSDVSALTTFVGRFRFPLVSIFDADRLPENFFTDGRPKAVLIVDSKTNPAAVAAVESEVSTDPIVRAFLEGARKHRHSVLATVCGVTSAFEKHMLELLGIDEDALPALRIMSVNPDSDGRHHPALKFRPEEPSSVPGRPRAPVKTLSPSTVSSFFDDFVARKLEPYYRSEAASDEEEPRGSVKTVVGSTFQQIVKDTDGDVFIEFYAPWCGYCRKLEPAYKELAARLRDVPGVTIAKIDATRNEVPGMKVAGYPTIFLFPHGKKNDPPLVYNGDRTVQDMLEWLQSRVARAHFDTGSLLALDLQSRGGQAVGSVLEEL